MCKEIGLRAYADRRFRPACAQVQSGENHRFPLTQLLLQALRKQTR